MIIPTKHQNLEENLISIGAELLRKIFIEDLFNYFKEKFPMVNLDNFFLCVTFLWLINSVDVREEIIKFKK